MTALLEAKDVKVRIGDVDILHGADLSVRAGELVAVVGPNGAGKSTLIKTIFGLLQPRSGRISFRGEELADDYAGTLSGGQRKLLELARALMTEPTMLLLDEPMAGINPTLGRRLLEHMHRLRDERGVTFLFIEHDMDVVMGHSEKVIVMADGRVIASGPPEEIRRDQRVIDAYLGQGAESAEATG